MYTWKTLPSNQEGKDTTKSDNFLKKNDTTKIKAQMILCSSSTRHQRAQTESSPVIPVEAEEDAAQEHRERRLLVTIKGRGRHHAPDALIKRVLRQNPVLRHGHQGTANLSQANAQT